MLNLIQKLKPFIILSLIISILTLSSISVICENDDSESSTKAEDTKKLEEDKPKQRGIGEKPTLGSGETGILIDQTGGNILLDYDSDKRMFPASTTKIMTALLIFEAISDGKISNDTQVEIKKEMIDGLPIDGTSMDLKEGEIVTIDALLKGMLIASGNDAASALAYSIDNNYNGFIDNMNKRATELGCTDTHFVNSHGLHDDNHYTTAKDMAKIARAAMKHYGFRNIVDCAHIKIAPTNLSNERYYISTNGLLSTMRYSNLLYKEATGIKTGHTLNAGNCLVASAKKNGIDLIAVVYGAKTAELSHKGCTEMFKYAFETHSSVSVLAKGAIACDIKVKQGKNSDKVALMTEEALNAVVPNGTSESQIELIPNIPKSVTAPIHIGDGIGTVSIVYNGVELYSCKLLASADVDRSFFWPILAICDFIWENTVTRIILIIVLIFIGFFILAFIYKLYQNIKAEQRRRKRMQKKSR